MASRVQIVESKQLYALLEQGELSVTVAHRRQTLLAIADLALKSKGLNPLSRWRIRTFKAGLAVEDNDDEIEVGGEILCETVLQALSALHQEWFR